MSSQTESAKYCIAMVTCMLTCKSGYRLGKTSDKNGCQSCICVNPSSSDKAYNEEGWFKEFVIEKMILCPKRNIFKK